MVKSQRKLLAIMFTDIVGYTSLMSSDEQRALKILHLSRNILKPIIKQFRGEWIKEMGDGSLSSFSSALDAVSCALEIQRALKDNPDFNIRIGIHVGDVVISKGDVFGTGVNIASRIELLAAPGNTCISDGFRPETESFPEARDLALRAIEIDPTIAEAHSILGMVKFLFEWEWNEAEKEFRYALKLNPNNANTRIMYALYLVAMGHYSESITGAKKAVELDPLSVICLSHLGIILLRVGLQEQADQCFHKVLELVPDHHNALWLYGQSLVLQSKYNEGIAALQKAVDLSDRNEMILAGLGWAYAIASRWKEAMDVLTELQNRSKSKPVRAIIFAKIYSGLGDIDEPFEWLEKAYQERNLPLAFIKTDETMENIRSDSRFRELLDRMRLSEIVLTMRRE